jgi:hypothetical protein
MLDEVSYSQWGDKTYTSPKFFSVATRFLGMSTGSPPTASPLLKGLAHDEQMAIVLHIRLLGRHLLSTVRLGIFFGHGWF